MTKHNKSDKAFRIFLWLALAYFVGHFIHAVAQGAIL